MRRLLAGVIVCVLGFILLMATVDVGTGAARRPAAPPKEEPQPWILEDPVHPHHPE